MSHPVGRSSNSPPSEPNPGQPFQGGSYSKVAAFFRKFFPDTGPAPTPSNPVSSRVSPLKTRLVELSEWVESQPETGPAPTPSNPVSSRVSPLKTRLDELSEWVEFQPENAIEEAREILATLNKIDLNKPFTLILDSKTKITSLPNILQNCKFLFCRNCTSLQTLPPELPTCQFLECSNCPQLRALPNVPQTAAVSLENCPNLPQEDRPNYGQLNGYDNNI